MPATVSSLKKEVAATLKRLENKDPGLKKFLNRAHGYAVFPSVGKADAVIGGAYGRGLVFERGKLIGAATTAQMTIGVQLGGDTFSEIVAFESEQSLDRFKRGKIAFAANASAVLVKAGAAASADYEKGCAVFVYASGGMMIEAAIGGQKFKFKPLSEAKGEEQDEGQEQEADEDEDRGARGQRDAADEDEESEEDESDQGEDEGEEGDELSNLFEQGSDLLNRATDSVKNAGSKVAQLVKEHPVAATLIGLGVAGGIAMLAARTVKSNSSGEGESDDDTEPDDDDDDISARDEADDSGDEDEDRSEDEGEDDEENVGTRARGRSSEEDEDDDDQADDEQSDTRSSGSNRRRRGRALS